MKRLELFKTLRKHRRLAEERMIDLEKNKAAKWIMYIAAAFVVLYLIIYAIIFALIANDMRTMSSIEFLLCALPVIFALDFSCRFMMQQTPSQVVKPYVLLPISKYTCVDFFLTGQMLNTSNLIWFFFLVPYCLMSVVFSYGLWACVGVLFFFWVFELCISQFYLIVRTLINDTLLWWLMPLALVIIAMLPGADFSNIDYIFSNFTKFYDFEDFFRFYGNIGEAMEEGSFVPYIGIVSLLALLFFINRRIQFSHVMSELSRVEKVVTVSGKNRLKFLDKLGKIGLFLGLEIKTSLRNKNPRKGFIMGISIVIMFSMLIIFTDVYDSVYMGNFWCMYNYTIFGAMSLVKIMCNEGNYIDGLMVRKENILQILRAKYFFNCIILLLPFCLMLPTVISGKWDFMMVFSYAIFTAGFQFFLLFQLAVSNRISQPLNTKFISKSGMENSKWQVIIEMFALFVPVVFVSILQAFLGNTWAYIIMFTIGLIFILCHKIWLRNIYNRFMNRRYENMEGFRASR